MKTIHYVTGNAAKFKEVKKFFARHAPDITIKQGNLDIPEIQSNNLKKVALDKATRAFRLLQKPCLIDDVGLFLEAYPNFPGPFFRWVHTGIGHAGLNKLIDEENRATITVCLVFIDRTDSFATFEGEVHGTLLRNTPTEAPPPVETSGIFIPDGAKESLYALKQKNKGDEYAPRIKALKKFLAWYENPNTA